MFRIPRREAFALALIMASRPLAGAAETIAPAPVNPAENLPPHIERLTGYRIVVMDLAAKPASSK